MNLLYFISFISIHAISSSHLDNILEEYIIKGKSDVEVYEGLKSFDNNNITKTNNRTLISLLYFRDYFRSLFYFIDNYYEIKGNEREDGLIKDILRLKKYMKDNNLEKREIIKITPLFEWGQNNSHVKMRIKFSKGLEVPGEKNILNFTVNLTSSSQFTVSGFKESNEGYVVWYYRRIELFAIVKPKTLKHYQETEGAYIVSFEKGVNTMYWNFLDLETEDHKNIFTWFDVFEKYDNEVKYVEYREWTRDNLLLLDLQNYLDEKIEEKKKRGEKIDFLLQEIKDKGEEIDNYCHTVPFNEECYLKNIYNWNYWLN